MELSVNPFKSPKGMEPMTHSRARQLPRAFCNSISGTTSLISVVMIGKLSKKIF
jgi:hypothetical protein